MARPRSFDEDDVIDRVTHTFWERGYANTSIADLEVATGLGRQSLYTAFGDKHALFLRALDRYALYGERQTPAPAFNSDAPLAQLKCMMRSTVAFATAPKAPGACLVVQAMVEFGSSDADVSKRCVANRSRIEAWVRRLVGEAATRGELATGLDPAAVTTLVMGQYFAIPLLARAGVPADELNAGIDVLVQQISRST